MTTSPTSALSSQDASRATTGLPDIAFFGKAGAGKSTAAEYLVKNHGYVRLSFAEPLKDIAEQLWGPEARTDREKLQALGVAAREIDPDVWVKQLVKRYSDTLGRIVIDDCRFPNEWWALKGLGFLLVKVVAPAHQRIDRLTKNGKFQSLEQLEHVSETALDDARTFGADHVIQNWETPHDLDEEVFRILTRSSR